MKILVTGANGQLGYDVVQELIRRHHHVVPTDSKTMNITDMSLVRSIIMTHQPDAVIHCAAYTAVDKAEEYPEVCFDINVNGTESIAKTCHDLDIKMIYISTDYVFNGTGEEFYQENSTPNPINQYGLTKYKGELAVIRWVPKHFIVRVSWVFGTHGTNFVKTMIRLGNEFGKVRVVKDQIGSPTFTVDLARLLADMIETEHFGTYHATNQGLCSWYEFANEIFKKVKMDVEVIPVDSSAFPTKARRPLNSRLGQDKLDHYGFNRLPSWQDALDRYLEMISGAD